MTKTTISFADQPNESQEFPGQYMAAVYLANTHLTIDEVKRLRNHLGVILARNLTRVGQSQGALRPDQQIVAPTE